MNLRIAIFAAAAVIIPASAFAQPVRNENLEPECKATGSGMDPRCIGDTTPGTVSDATTARQQRVLEYGPRPARVAPRGREVIIENR